MKAFNLAKSLVLILICITSFALTSCSNDDDQPVIPSNAKEAVGTYDANIVVHNNKTIANVVIGQVFSISKFPVTDIVDSIVAKSDREAAVKSLKDIVYSMSYQAKIVDKKVILTLLPGTLSFNIMVKNKVQKVQVTFASTNTAEYDTTKKTLAGTLNAINVSLDGKNVSTFKAVDYQLSATKKN